MIIATTLEPPKRAEGLLVEEYDAGRDHRNDGSCLIELAEYDEGAS